MAKTKKLDIENKKDYIQCVGECREIKHKKNFYKSNKLEYDNLGNYCNVCKECLREMTMKNNQISIEGIRQALEFVDKPFIWSVYYKIAKSKFDLGIYLRQMNTSQYKNLTYKDSDKDEIEEEIEENRINKRDGIIKKEIKIPEEIIFKWGENYTDQQYKKLESFYIEMCDTYDISTPSHKKYLIFISKLNLKMDECLEKGETADFAKLAAQYETMMKSAKLRPLDKVSADMATGIRTFSQIFEEVEKTGFIKPTPITENQDIVDKTIMYILNYTRKLVGVQRLATPPIDTPKEGLDEVLENIEIDMTKDVEDGGDS